LISTGHVRIILIEIAILSHLAGPGCSCRFLNKRSQATLLTYIYPTKSMSTCQLSMPTTKLQKPDLYRLKPRCPTKYSVPNKQPSALTIRISEFPENWIPLLKLIKPPSLYIRIKVIQISSEETLWAELHVPHKLGPYFMWNPEQGIEQTVLVPVDFLQHAFSSRRTIAYALKSYFTTGNPSCIVDFNDFLYLYVVWYIYSFVVMKKHRTRSIFQHFLELVHRMQPFPVLSCPLSSNTVGPSL